jgi:AraC-like DNA-binding protein
MLLSRRVSVGYVAEQVGYQSERAFRAAFTRRYGLPPLRYAKTKVADLVVTSALVPR